MLFPASSHDGAGKLSRRSVKTFMMLRENFPDEAGKLSRTIVTAVKNQRDGSNKGGLYFKPATAAQLQILFTAQPQAANP